MKETDTVTISLDRYEELREIERHKTEVRIVRTVRFYDAYVCPPSPPDEIEFVGSNEEIKLLTEQLTESKRLLSTALNELADIRKDLESERRCRVRRPFHRGNA